MAEVVPSWHDFIMTWQSRVKLGRFVHMKSYQIGTTGLNLKYFLNGHHFDKKKKTHHGQKPLIRQKIV